MCVCRVWGRVYTETQLTDPIVATFLGAVQIYKVSMYVIHTYLTYIYIHTCTYPPLTQTQPGRDTVGALPTLGRLCLRVLKRGKIVRGLVARAACDLLSRKVAAKGVGSLDDAAVASDVGHEEERVESLRARNGAGQARVVHGDDGEALRTQLLHQLRLLRGLGRNSEKSVPYYIYYTRSL